MNRVFTVISFLCFLAIQTSVLAQYKPVYRYNLKECTEMALKNNEVIKASHYDVISAIAQKMEATKRYVPVVNYEYRVAPVPRDINNPTQSFVDGDISIFNSVKIEMGVPVTTFGKLTVSKELADLGIDASRLKKKRKANEVVTEVYKLYHGILLARELKILANKGLDAVNKKVEELQKEENTDQLQILKLKAIIYQVEKKLDEAIKKETIAFAMLKYQIGLEDDANFNLKDTHLKRVSFKMVPFAELLSQSKERRPEFQLLAFQVEANRKKIILEKKAYLPLLTLGAFLDYGVSPGIRGDEDETSLTNPLNFTKAGAGLKLSGDLDFRKIKSKVEMAKAAHLKSIAEKRSNYRLLEIDLKNAYLNLVQKRKLLYRAEKEQRSARQIVFLTKSNLDIGLGEKKDYLEALQSYLLIQAAVYENIFNYNLAVSNVKSKVGTLYDSKLLEL